MVKLKIEEIKISEIHPYGRNAKEHPEEQIQQICRSIEEFGFNDPIAIDEAGMIIEGEGRYLAAVKLKLEEVPVIRLEHLNEDQKKAYIIAHNKLCLNSGFDMDVLLSEIQCLIDNEFDINLTGFDVDDFDVSNFSRDKNPDAIPTEFPAKVVSGDIWKLGDHILICRDSTKPKTYDLLMNDIQADLLLTDPPYNVAYKGSGRNTKKEIINDNLKVDEFVKFIGEAFSAMKASLKLGVGMYVFHSSQTSREFQEAIEGIDGKIISQIIWVKNNAVLGWSDYRWKHEPVFYACFKGYKPKFYGDRKQTSVWDFNDKTDRQLLNIIKRSRQDEEAGLTTIWKAHYNNHYEYHPTQKPINLLQIPIKNSSKPGDIVLDPFGGSGSTLIACEMLQRKCRTIEIDTKYCDAIIARWEYFTDMKAEKI
jgi:DNA modification methylase